jgi:hypothetical protein
VNLGNCALETAFIFNPIAAAGNNFTIIGNDGGDPVGGTFAGLPEGAVFWRSGIRWQISYSGGTGNDVVLSLLELAPPEITSVEITQSVNVLFRLDGTAPARTTCRAQFSGDMITWTNAAVALARDDGTFTISFARPAASPRVFVRVMLQ